MIVSRLTLARFGMTILQWGGIALATACFPFNYGLAEELEYEVKAAYLLNFARYVEWGPSEDISREASLTLCLVGSNPFAHLIETLQAKKVRGLSVALTTIASLKEIPAECQIVFVPDSDSPLAVEQIRPKYKEPFLLVTESSLVGAINFLMIDRKVRFDVNLEVAKKFGVQVGSQLLKLAVEVKREESE